MIGPYAARSRRTQSLVPQSPLRPSPHLQREQRVHREGLVGELTQTDSGWVLESRDLLVNGEPLSGQALIHGDCLETTDSRAAWIVTFPDLGPADTGWGPLWSAWRRGALTFEATAQGLVVQLGPVPDWSSLELLAAILKSELPERLARLKLTVTSLDPLPQWDALIASHRERVAGAHFALELRAPERPPRLKLKTPEAEWRPHAIFPRDGRWQQVALRADGADWVLDAVAPPLRCRVSREGVEAGPRWLEPFFHGEQCLVLSPARSPLFGGERRLTQRPTEASVSVFVDELIELGDPCALLLREQEPSASLRHLAFPFASDDPFVGGIVLDRSTHVGGFFTELLLKPWPELQAELPLLLAHPLCVGVTQTRLLSSPSASPG